MRQVRGILGWVVDRMIRNSVRARFRALYWDTDDPDFRPDVGIRPDWLRAPAILAANHHGWFDGYVLYHLVTKLELPTLDWIAEFGAFPLFAKVGGMPFPPDRPDVRGKTIRETIRQMNRGDCSLMLFPEGELHPPPDLLPFGRTLEFVHEKTGARVHPVAIAYPFSLHERPEAYVRVGRPLEPGPQLGERARTRVRELLHDLQQDIRVQEANFGLLARGTLDVNERWDMRRIRNSK